MGNMDIDVGNAGQKKIGHLRLGQPNGFIVK
jgi:hypothetical protein